MSKYVFRLDDACEKMDIDNWHKIEDIFSEFDIKPLVGIIPHCEDEKFNKYKINNDFWNLVHKWINKGWIVAMHGYNHVYISNSGGINPVNNKSEFAGVSYELQKEKIINGIKELSKHDIYPKVFFAPSHTFDYNTISALKNNSNIKIISDTIARDTYNEFGITFVPQQLGRPRKLPFKLITICLHPNTMQPADFLSLESFIRSNKNKIYSFPLAESNRKYDLIDNIISNLYFKYKKLKRVYCCEL